MENKEVAVRIKTTAFSEIFQAKFSVGIKTHLWIRKDATKFSPFSLSASWFFKELKISTEVTVRKKSSSAKLVKNPCRILLLNDS